MLPKLVYMPPLRDDEQIEGWIDCVRSVYRIRRTEILTRGLGLTEALSDQIDYDLQDCRERDLLLKVISDRGTHPLAREDSQAAPNRRAFCPQCFSQNVRRGELPSFRLAWASVLVTHCDVHQTPLIRWKYSDDFGDRRRSLPPMLVNQFLRHTDADGSLSNPEAPRDFGAAFVVAMSQKLSKGAEQVYGYRQQLLWERLLLGEGSAVVFPFGVTTDELRRMVHDITTLLMSTFNASAGPPVASRLGRETGPLSLFPGFRGFRAEIQSQRMVVLADIDEPGFRRTVLNQAMRLLLALTSEVQFDEGDGAIVGAPQPPSLCAFKDVGLESWAWFEGRIRDWPEPMRQLLQHAFPEMARLSVSRRAA